MAMTDRGTVKAICASIIFSSRFKRELEKASVVGDPSAREDTIILSRHESIREAMDIAEEIIARCAEEKSGDQSVV